MPLEPMKVVAAGTYVDVSITLPKEQGGMRTGFRWQAPEMMTAAEARADLERDLFARFLNVYLPAE